MAIRFDTTDPTGAPFEWKLERGGTLYARAAGKQRWRVMGKGFPHFEAAKMFVGAYQNHTVTDGRDS